MGNVINFRSDAPGIIQYHFAFYEIIPIYVLIMISKKSHINQIKHESNDNVILYILFNMFVSFYQEWPRTLWTTLVWMISTACA